MIHHMFLLPRDISELEKAENRSAYLNIVQSIKAITNRPLASILLFQSYCVHSVKGLLDLGQFFHIRSVPIASILVCIDDNQKIDTKFFSEAVVHGIQVMHNKVEEIRIILPISETEVEIISELTQALQTVHDTYGEGISIRLFDSERFMDAYGIEPLKDLKRLVH
jgi:hypothetical protein